MITLICAILFLAVIPLQYCIPSVVPMKWYLSVVSGVWSITLLLLSRMFRIAAIEVDEVKDNNYLFGLFTAVDDVMAEWHSYIAAEKEKQLNEIIAEEKLKADETKKFVDNAIADGEMRTTGTDIDKLMPPISRFGNTNREKKKQTIIEKLKAFFERFFGV